LCPPRSRRRIGEGLHRPNGGDDGFAEVARGKEEHEAGPDEIELLFHGERPEMGDGGAPGAARKIWWKFDR